MLNMLTLPVFLLSGIALPLHSGPSHFTHARQCEPLAYAVNAARDLFPGHIASVAVVEGFLLTGILALLALVWVTCAFQKATA